MLLADLYMLFKVIYSLIRNLSAVSASFFHIATQRFTVAPTVAPTVGFQQLPEHLRRHYKVLGVYRFSAKTARHIWRLSSTLLVVFYAIFFTQIYNALIVWHSKLCENEQENMYSAHQIFKLAYRSYFMHYIIYV